MALGPSSDIVSSFLKEYPALQPYWKGLAMTTYDICRKSLNIQGIDALTTFREKSHESLKEKVPRFSVQRGGYKTKEEIYGEIPDFAGVRIVLYIPSQKDIVDNIIKRRFEKVEVVNHTGENDKQRGRTATGSHKREYKSLFLGYSGTHYQVQLRKEDVAIHEISYIPGHVIEIQVVSALQNAWAEVEHDIRYKTLAGPPSQEEHIILDCLRYLVQSGDLLLDQLHDKYMLRKTAVNDGFTNEFALATFLFGWISRTLDKRDLNIGPVEALLKLLKIYKLDNPVDLQVELESMDFQRGSNPQTKSTEEKFQPFELGASIHIMNHILLTKGESFSAASAAKEAKERYGEYGYKIRVMISAIMWLDEFFPPVLRWEEKFSDHSKNHEQEESLSWFIRTVRLMKILRDGADPSQKEEAMLNDLWGWFEGHGEEVVKFVWKLAKMGILKDLPKEMSQFKRVCSSVKFLFSCQGL